MQHDLELNFSQAFLNGVDFTNREYSQAVGALGKELSNLSANNLFHPPVDATVASSGIGSIDVIDRATRN